MVVEGSRKAQTQPEIQDEPKQEDDSMSEASGHSEKISALEQSLSKLNLQQNQEIQDKEGFRCHCSTSVSSHVNLTEREIALIIVLSRMLQKGSITESVAAIFLLHTVLIGFLPLPHRSYVMERGDDSSESRIDIVLAELSVLLTMLLSENSWADSMQRCEIPCDLSDLVDGRLLKSVSSKSRRSDLDAHTTKRFDELAHALCATCSIHLKAPESSADNKSNYGEANGTSSNNMTILPFSNPVFDKHLSSISLRVSPSKASDRLSGRIHQEVSHWHNAKRRLDPKQSQITPASEKEKFRALRRNQFFMAEMQAYAASLTNAAGKALEPEIVTVSASSYPDTKMLKAPPEKPQKGKPTSNRKGGGKKIMLEGIAANKAVKDSENDERVFSSWRTVRKNLDSERQLQSKYFKIKSYLRDLPESKRLVVQAEVEYHLLCVLYEIYRLLRKVSTSQTNASSQEELLGIAALMWDTSRGLASVNGLTKTIAERTALISRALSLPDPGISPPAVDRKLTYDPEIILSDNNELEVGLDAIQFQLEYCGPYFDRNLDSAPDSRVPFQPDGWQRRVLDELDAQNSVFVVAPTSAGKTFISFYAMEKILRENDDSVLVYVAPTKALVNQIAAEIQARFKKTYKHAGKSTWAIHTRDYRINSPSGCQILVTVPHILQIMLLAPSNAKSWSPRVKYIIFDEIHSIGQAEDGVVWEQLLLLAPCPIIALSATVGNPEMFNSWLDSTQHSFGHQVAMIKHQHRYSELRKFVFVPPRKFAFRGLADRPSFAALGLDGLPGLSFVHPIASLINKTRGMPDDLSLEARDCLSLFRAMKRHATAVYPVDPNLDPSKRKLPKVIRKVDVIRWEQDLKHQLKHWMTNNDSPFDAVLHDLSKSMEEDLPVDKEVSKGEITDETDDLIDVDSGNLYATTLPLLCKLHQRDALPAIFFNYDRHKCENIARTVMSQLEDAESHWKETNPSWKSKLNAYDKWKLEKEKLGNKRSAKVVPKKKGKGDVDDDPSSKLDKLQDAASEEANPFASFDPEAPIDGFHFAAKHLADAEDLSRAFWQMKRRGVAPWLTVALQRGIGVHHAG